MPQQIVSEIGVQGDIVSGTLQSYEDFQRFIEELRLSDEDKQVVESVKATGVGVLPDLLSGEALQEVRSEFDEAYRVTGMDTTKPGKKFACLSFFDDIFN